MKKTLLPALALLLLVLFSCKDDPEPVLTPVYTPTPYELPIPFGFPKKLNIPADNPLTVEGIELGRYLFYDGRLSGRTEPDSLMSCATCHLQENAFECGIDHPEFAGGKTHGLTGIPTPHYMLPVVNLVWHQHGYLWNGFVSESNSNPMLRNIEALVYMSIVAPHEMNGDTSRSVAMIRSIDGYTELFKKAFGSDEINLDRISKAIAQFIRTIVSSDSKFDRYLRGEVQLSQSELNGYVLFTTEEGADCFHCHGAAGNPLFTTSLFYNNGKDSVFTDSRDRFSVTGDPNDHGAYKAPSLRNIALTAPYMHDGRFKTLDEIIDFYSGGLVYSPYVDPLMHWLVYGGTRLTQKEKEDLKAFLLTLTDENLLTNQAYSKPADLPR
jgi:cytochrome c peroxidase